jgi:hypothetical protein
MDVEDYIHQKVKLFKNSYYFPLFKTILINLSKNISIYKKQYSLSGRMENLNINKDKSERVSLWFYIMKIVLDKLKPKDKTFFIKNNLDENPLVFSYLVKLCKTKIHKLEKLSIIENAPMENLIRLYLDLCQKEINPELDEKNLFQKTLFGINENDKNKISNKLNQIKGKLINNTAKNIREEDPIENDMKKKYGIGRIKLTYNRSLCRLFIGDTDEKSIQKKHLMSITVKKDRTVKINGIPIGKSESYAKRIINEIGEEKGYYIDDDLNKIINKFKREQKFLDEYRKNLKLEENVNFKKLRETTKFNEKNMRKLTLGSPKEIYKSPSQFDFKSFNTLKNKSRNSNLINFYTNKYSKTNTINFKNSKFNSNSISNNKRKYSNIFLKFKIDKRKIVFSGLKGKRKISKFTLGKFSKYKDTPTSFSSGKKKYFVE